LAIEPGKATQDDRYDIVPEGTQFEPGFNMKTVWGALFVGFVMLPGAIYLGLMTGQSMAGGAEWVTIILFLEIAKRSFVKMKAQEIIILYWVAGGLVMMGGKLGTGANLFGGPFGGLIWNQYFIQSPLAIGIDVPTWAAPPVQSPAIIEKTFWHIDWLIPVVLLFVTMLFRMAGGLSFGYVMFRITSDVERLEFPMARVQAGGATALAETSGKSEGWRWRVFSIGSFIGIMWGLLYVVVPTISGILLTDVVQIIPIPFVDFTSRIKNVLPASTMGLMTNLGTMLAGLVLPFWIIVGQFATTMIIQLFVNPRLYEARVLTDWVPGMSVIPTSIVNNLNFWLSFTIGTAFVVALLGFALAGRAFVARSRLKKESGRQGSELPKGRGDVPIPLALAIWAISTLAFVVLCRILVPSFPWWITAAFGFVWSPFISYVGTRMLGLTGTPAGVSFPYLKEASFYLSGYKGAAIWFAPVPLYNHVGYANQFKQMDMTKTNFRSLVKMRFFAIGVMFVCSFIFWSFIWRLARIPSGAYPYVNKMWPFFATFQAIFIRTTLEGGTSFVAQVIKWKVIIMGFSFGWLLYIVLALTGAPRLLFYGFASGVGMWPHMSIPLFIGAMLRRFYFERKFGVAKWRAYAPILLAGFSCGMGLVGMTSIAVALIAKSISPVIY